MCIVLDVNVFSEFFNESNSNYGDFEKLRKWVLSEHGKLIYGGSKYKQELTTAHSYLRIMVGLERAGKLICLDDSEVDDLQEQVEKIEPSKKFDDPHLVAIIISSKCRIICTNDKRAIPYLKDQRFYKKPVLKPKVYSSDRNESLLIDKNIADVCRENGSHE